MTASTGRKVALLSSLYLCQGLPFGFFTQALPVVLRQQQQGVALGAIGMTALLAAPWALRFLWAPVVDRRWSTVLGRRRSWILPLQALTIASLCVVASLDATATAPLLVAVFAINLLAATQDVATDGLAVDGLTARERGIGNGVQVAGYRVGMILGGGVMLVALERLGWAATFVAMRPSSRRRASPSC